MKPGDGPGRLKLSGILLALSLLGSGCVLNTTLEITQQPGKIGTPFDFKVTVQNPKACPATDVQLIVLPLLPRVAEVENICALAQNPLNGVCSEFPSGDIPPDLLMTCCLDTQFAHDNPDLCEPLSNQPTSLADRVRSILKDHPVETTAIPAHTDSGAAVSCLDLTPMLPVISCMLDDIPAMMSEVVHISVTPGQNGNFDNVAIVQADFTCLSENEAPGGSTCVTAQVGPAKGAPVLSLSMLAVLLGLLVGLGVWRVRMRRPRPGVRA